MHTIGHDGIQL